jgi:hypothetical protein
MTDVLGSRSTGIPEVRTTVLIAGITGLLCSPGALPAAYSVKFTGMKMNLK